MSDSPSVRIEAVGSLSRFVTSPTILHNVETVGEAVAQLALPEEAGQLMMLVNGKMAYWHTRLSNGDTLKLLPSITGE